MDSLSSSDRPRPSLFASADLVLAAFLVLSGVLSVVTEPPPFLRVIIAIPFLLIVPGYLLVLALFPRQADMGPAARVGLSLVCSSALIGVLSFVLSQSQFGLSEWTLVVGAGLMAGVLIVAAEWRRRTVAVGGQAPFVPVRSCDWRESASSTSRSPAAMFLVATILLTAGAVGFGFAVPATQERFTELVAHDLVRSGIGTNTSLLLEVRNHEGADLTYTCAAVLVNRSEGSQPNGTGTTPVALLGSTSISVEDGATGRIVVPVPPNGTSGADLLRIELFPTEIRSFDGAGDPRLREGYRNLTIHLPAARE